MGNFSSSSVHFASICNLNLKKGGGDKEEEKKWETNPLKLCWNCYKRTQFFLNIIEAYPTENSKPNLLFLMYLTLKICMTNKLF